MFKNLINWYNLKNKKKEKKQIGFGFEEPKEDNKLEHVHETFSIWCASTSKGDEVEGHEERFDEGARNKEIFTRRAEMKG